MMTEDVYPLRLVFLLVQSVSRYCSLQQFSKNERGLAGVQGKIIALGHCTAGIPTFLSREKSITDQRYIQQ